MELITILSTIILIATISTFILSVGAYILFKIRSRREQKPLLASAGPTKAELVTVREQDGFEELHQQVGKTNLPMVQINNAERESVKTARRSNTVTEKPKQERTVFSKYVKYNSEGSSDSEKNRSSGDLQWK
jgi:hypothetical protein